MARVFLCSSGVTMTLGTLGETGDAVYDINNMEQVAGSAGNANGEDHAFVFSNGTTTMTDLGTLGGISRASRTYLHAVIDNFSRRILAWKVTPTFEPAATAEILLAASQGVAHGTPTVLTDGGRENFNGAVDELIHSGLLQRLLARTEITHSNSLEEQSLFEAEVSMIVRWYNEYRPHETLGAKTPNEAFFSHEAANEQPRLEPRERWPRGSPCAKPQVAIDGEPGDPIILEIDCLEGRRHLPIIRARRAA